METRYKEHSFYLLLINNLVLVVVVVVVVVVDLVAGINLFLTGVESDIPV